MRLTVVILGIMLKFVTSEFVEGLIVRSFDCCIKLLFWSKMLRLKPLFPLKDKGFRMFDILKEHSLVMKVEG